MFLLINLFVINPIVNIDYKLSPVAIYFIQINYNLSPMYMQVYRIKNFFSIYR